MKVKGLKRRIRARHGTISNFARKIGMDPAEMHRILKRAAKNRGINASQLDTEGQIEQLKTLI